MIEKDGLKVITTLDYEKQKKAEEILTEKTKDYPEKWDAHNAALLTIDVQSGDILAMLGSRDFFDNEIDGQVNITTANRQPGSSIKPLVYALAFEKDYQPKTILFDVETTFKTDQKDYQPLNYDLETHGPVSLRQALAGSLNIPAVKLMYLVKVPAVLDYLKKIGYTNIKDASNYGLSLVLGGLEVKMIEHLNAFTVFARRGIQKPTRAILRIEDSSGKIIYENKEEKGNKIISEDIADKLNSCLSDNDARAFVFGANNYLTLANRPVAAKTGTTNNFNDAWTIGYTPHLATAVWVGNNDNQDMKIGAAGGAIAAPIWKEYMTAISADYPADEFPAYQAKEIDKPMLGGNVAQEIKVKIESESGLLATENTPPSKTIEKTCRKLHNILHYVNPLDPLGPWPEEPEKESNYQNWEEGILKWAEEEEIEITDPPTEYETQYLAKNKPKLKITYPAPKQKITSPNINFQIEAQAQKDFYIDRVIYKINDRFIGSTRQDPYNYNYRFGSGIKNGEQELKVLVFDNQENFQEEKIKFTLDIPRENEYQINWEIPNNNAVIKQEDFPLDLQVNIDQPEKINKIDFYFIKQDSANSNWLATETNINSYLVNFSWKDLPAIGEYTIFAIMTDQNNITYQDPGINITIE